MSGGQEPDDRSGYRRPGAASLYSACNGEVERGLEYRDYGIGVAWRAIPAKGRPGGLPHELLLGAEGFYGIDRCRPPGREEAGG